MKDGFNIRKEEKQLKERKKRTKESKREKGEMSMKGKGNEFEEWQRDGKRRVRTEEVKRVMEGKREEQREDIEERERQIEIRIK